MNLYDFDLSIEKEFDCNVIGIDEAGRGPLAGPVVAAAVLLDLYAPIDGVDDSKKLSSKKRECLYDIIISNRIWRNLRRRTARISNSDHTLSRSSFRYGDQGKFGGHDYRKKENNRYPTLTQKIFKGNDSSFKQFVPHSHHDNKKILRPKEQQRLNTLFQKELNKRIIKSRSVEEILEIYRVENQRLDVVNLTTIFYNLGI